jgi:hypothetical protein
MAKPTTQPHPLAHAAKNIGSDLLSTLLFVATYAIWHSIPLAVGVGVAFGLAQIVALKLRRASIDLRSSHTAAFGISALRHGRSCCCSEKGYDGKPVGM